MANIFATPVDTFSMASGLYNAFAKGQKDAEDLQNSQFKRDALKKQLDQQQADRDYQIQKHQEMSGVLGGQQQQPTTTLANGLADAAGVKMPAASDTFSLIKGFESYRDKPYWDVNAHRIGYGSDTITRPDGSIVRVQPGMQINRDDAERDLQRRVTSEFMPRAQKAVGGGEVWQRLDPPTQAALTSITYNYGKLPETVARAVQTGDKGMIAVAVEGLADHNDGINRKRRLQEAAIIRSGFTGQQQPTQTASYNLQADMPSESAQETAFTIPGQEPQQQQATPFVPENRAQAQSIQRNTAYWAGIMSDPRVSEGQRATASMMYKAATSPNEFELLKEPKTGRPLGIWDKTNGRRLSEQEAAARGIVIQPQEQQAQQLFDGSSVQGQGLNYLVNTGRLTMDQAANIAAGKTITGPNGEVIFMTPEGIVSRNQQGQQPQQGQAIAQAQAAPQAQQAQSVPGVQLTTGKPPQLTEGQANAGIYSDRMKQAEAILANPKFYEQGKSIQNALASAVPGVGNMLVPSEFQQLQQAKSNFINATLRRESGAAISPQEFKKADDQYFPQIGDKPEVIQLKAENRRLAEAAIRMAAGPNYVSQLNQAQQAQTQAQPMTQEPVRVNSPQDVAGLPSGTIFITPDGRRKVKP